MTVEAISTDQGLFNRLVTISRRGIAATALDLPGAQQAREAFADLYVAQVVNGEGITGHRAMEAFKIGQVQAGRLTSMLRQSGQIGQEGI